MKKNFRDTRTELHTLIDLFLKVNQPGPYLNGLNLAAASLSEDADHKRSHQNMIQSLKR